MKKSSAIILSALAVLFVSCAKDNLREKDEPSKPQVALVPMTFSAGTPSTRTAIATNGKSINWVAEDKIAVFDDKVGDALEFTLEGEGGSTSASFTGSVPEGSTEYYAVYPYTSGAYCSEGDIVGLSISADQTSTAANISAGIMAAKADASNKFAFKNATALLKFNITATDIAKVVITGAGNEKIAGDVELTVDETAALLDETKLTETSITVGDGSTALSAGDYYVVIAPKDNLSGLKFTFTSTDGLTAELSGGKVTIAAGDLINLGTLAPKFSYDLTVAQLLEKISASADITKFNVTGVVSYSETQGTVFARGTVLLQDNVDEPNTGIAIYNGDTDTGLYKSEDIKVGNKVKISLANATASAATDNYGLQLSGVTSSDVAEVISTGNEIVKATAAVSALSSYKAQYVQIANATPSVSGYMNSKTTTYTFKSGTESINVYVKSASWKGADLYMDNTMIGTLYGFVAYFKTAWQICPAYADDVKEFVSTTPQIISISATELKWNATEYGSTNAKTVTVNGQYLTSENLSAALSNDTNFTSTLTVAEDGNSATVSIYPKAENTSTTESLTATLTITLGETVKTVALTQGKSGEATTVTVVSTFNGYTNGTSSATFKTSETNGLTWTSSITVTSNETSSLARGLSFGKALGKFTITGTGVNTGVKKISMVVSTNGTASTNTISVTVGGVSLGSEVKLAKANNQTITFSSETVLSKGDIVISVNDANKSVYFKSITINPAE